MANEADTCRRYVVPRPQAAGWDKAPPPLSREHAQRLRSEKKDFVDQNGAEARAILHELLDKYTEHGTAQFVIPDALELPPINRHGNVIEIVRRFGGEDRLAEAVRKLQTLLYAA